MITNKNRNQQQLFDHWQNMGAKRRKLLKESWAGLFRTELLPTLPVEALAAHFTSDFGRLRGMELNSTGAGRAKTSPPVWGQRYFSKYLM